VGIRAGTPARAQSGAGRNVLVLVADTLRADHVGCYGARRTRTPNIDALAKRGTRVGGVSAVSAWTAPNTASILTGLYPDRHGLLSYHDRLDPEAVSFAQIFKRAGYDTAGFSANPILSPRIGFGAGFDVWQEDLIDAGMRRHPRSPLAATLRLLGWLPPPERFPRADEMVDRALEWLDRPHDAPFLLYLQFMDAHDPYDPPPPFDTMYGAGTGFRMKLGTLSDVMAARLPAGPRELRTMEDLYDGAVSFMDDRIGHLLKEMARRRLLDDTLVVFTSDHGEEFLDHGDLEHTRTLYQEIVHTPLIFAGPGVLKGGAIEGSVPAVDIAPTLIDGAGLGTGGAFDGTSLWPALTGAAPAQPAESFMSLLYFGYRSPYHALVSIRSGDLKLLGTRRSSADRGAWLWQLFDIAADPGETRDLSAGRDSDLATLRSRVEAWQKRPGAVERKPKKEDSEIERRLRTLGYVD
ncbi:MAG TPA: sulfatase, partial [Candidatus Saccharimonadales bacterium]|nr:sulfatase [Candidatus Saccharimonadales bacterium]